MPVATSHPGRVVVLASGTGSVFDAFARAVTVEGEIEITADVNGVEVKLAAEALPPSPMAVR